MWVKIRGEVTLRAPVLPSAMIGRVLGNMSNTSSLSKIAWPEEQAQASRAGVVEAPTMEEDDDDDDFEDAEEGEEEDSDDSMS
ncbi:hypothetical protein LR48_Vigan04g119900 [Vigna angularis]|uniref:Uncharacterized protein n=1 Tax=Phaseolus angularis TaxID=3914 RepID=A0A0L9UE79_PHAAN|nr:hypothetical protein LR48_Vigan04g119900 [Vigna angularis]